MSSALLVPFAAVPPVKLTIAPTPVTALDDIFLLDGLLNKPFTGSAGCKRGPGSGYWRGKLR